MEAHAGGQAAGKIFSSYLYIHGALHGVLMLAFLANLSYLDCHSENIFAMGIAGIGQHIAGRRWQLYRYYRLIIYGAVVTLNWNVIGFLLAAMASNSCDIL